MGEINTGNFSKREQDRMRKIMQGSSHEKPVRFNGHGEVRSKILDTEGTEFELPEGTVWSEVSFDELDKLDDVLVEIADDLAHTKYPEDTWKFSDMIATDPATLSLVYQLPKKGIPEGEMIHPAAAIFPDNTPKEVVQQVRRTLSYVPMVNAKNTLLDEIGRYDRERGNSKGPSRALGKGTVSRVVAPSVSKAVEHNFGSVFQVGNLTVGNQALGPYEEGSSAIHDASEVNDREGEVEQPVVFRDESSEAIEPEVVKGPAVFTSPDSKFTVQTGGGVTKVYRGGNMTVEGDFNPRNFKR